MNKYSYVLILAFVALAGAAISLFMMKEMDWRALALICASSVLGILAQLVAVKKVQKDKHVA